MNSMSAKLVCAAAVFLLFCAPAHTQTAESEPASRDDVILYLRTMHSHDMMIRMMEVQSQSMQQMFRDQILKDKGSLPPEFEAHFKKAMDDLIKGMPVDEMTQAMIPPYQKHFTKSDMEAMNAFYSSPVGQKFLAEAPVVTQEAMQEIMPALSKYIGEWKERMEKELKEEPKAPAKDPAPAPSQN